ncbi:hypothetical protein ACWJKU_13285 [Methylocaldum sp. MU1018]
MNNQNQLSDAFAQAVVRAQLKVEELAEKHAEAIEKLETIRDRIARIESERSELISKRNSGDDSDATAGRVYMLGLDLDALRPLLVEASNEESAVNADLAGSRGQLAAAQQAWDRHQRETLLASLKERAVQVEQLLFAILGDMTAVGAQLGKPSLTSVYTVSNDLRNLASFGALPGRGWR